MARYDIEVQSFDKLSKKIRVIIFINRYDYT